MTFARTAVVGAGLIGGSLALRLRDLGADVVVVDPDAATRDAAAAAGLVVADEVPGDRDLVLLAGPLDVIVATLPALAGAAPDAVLVDVGLPDRDGVSLAGDLVALSWRPRIVLTSTDPDATSPDAARRLGASGFVPKHELPGAGLDLLLHGA